MICWVGRDGVVSRCPTSDMSAVCAFVDDYVEGGTKETSYLYVVAEVACDILRSKYLFAVRVKYDPLHVLLLLPIFLLRGSLRLGNHRPKPMFVRLVLYMLMASLLMPKNKKIRTASIIATQRSKVATPWVGKYTGMFQTSGS